jgi:serine protease
MKIKQPIVIILSALALLTTSITGAAPLDFKIKQLRQTGQTGHFKRIPGEILVRFSTDVTREDINAINSTYGTKIKRKSLKPGKFTLLSVKDPDSTDDVLKELKKNSKVKFAMENLVSQALFTPNDPYFSYQWNFHNNDYGGINMPNAWDLAGGGASGVTVAVLDTGVAYDMPDFSTTNFTTGYDFVNNDADGYDDEGHGSHVAGTIAQSTDNFTLSRNKRTKTYIGVAGIAFNTSIMPVKVLAANGYGSADMLIDGIDFAAQNGAEVINMSLSFGPTVGPEHVPLIEQAIEDAYNSGVTLVAAAGNEGAEFVEYPASSPYVISVGATGYDEQRAPYSNYGSGLDIAAPGGDFSSDLNGDGYVDGILQQTFGAGGAIGYYFYQGTSMASPHVAGVAALLIATGTTGPDNVRTALLNSAEDKGDTGWDPIYGHGLLDAHGALSYGGSTEPPNQPPEALATASEYNVELGTT